MNILAIIRSPITWVLLALCVGFGSGWQVHSWYADSKQNAELRQEKKALESARADDSKEVAKSQETSVKLADKVQGINDRTDKLKKEIHRYAPARTDAGPTGEAAGSGLRLDGKQADCRPDPAFLSRGELWVLDAAREAREADQPAPFSDAEGREPSDVTRAEFLENDLEVVKRFNRLKAKHDVLVDYLLELQREQRKRLGAPE